MAFKPEEREWLEEHGVWQDCWRRKEEYKAAGHKPAEAQRLAWAEFYRPNHLPAVASAQASAEAVSQ